MADDKWDWYDSRFAGADRAIEKFLSSLTGPHYNSDNPRPAPKAQGTYAAPKPRLPEGWRQLQEGGVKKAPAKRLNRANGAQEISHSTPRVSKASRDPEEQARSVKRLGGKRPVKRGEM